MSRGRKPFWTVDCESDPFETDSEAVARRDCPECGALKGKRCKQPRGVTIAHEKRRRIPQPFVWGLYGGPTREEYHLFRTVEELVAFLAEKPHVVYAHNGGKFDYHYLRDHINTGENIAIIAGRLAKFRIGECEFRDSMNILPVPLAEFKKDEIDYGIMEPEVRYEPKNWETITKYLRADCEYLYELIEAHRAENGVALTQAGASMRAWSKQSGLKPPRQSSALYQLYKPFYYGGRVQCFEQGTGSRGFQVIDINSAYPFAMLSAHAFSPSAARGSHLPPDRDLHKCLITLTCTARGCFPFRIGDDPTKGDLFFPYDEHEIRRYHITGYEFIAALKHDAIKNVTIETVHLFKETVRFEDFILSNWDRRAKAKAEGNKALSIIVKLLMNSLYGKFASDYNKYRDYRLCWFEDLLKVQHPEFEGGRPFTPETDWGNQRWLVSRPIPEDKHRFFNIATAASITGYVRAMLFEALCQVTTPLYCDTDSIACAATGSLSLGDGLGQWKVEGDFDRYAIAGKKLYAFHKTGHPDEPTRNHKREYDNYKCASKGVDLPPADIWTVAEGMSATYAPKVPTYSVKRKGPIYVPRSIKLTAKDIRKVPA